MVAQMFDRIPPQSQDAEASLLGSMMIDPAVIPAVRSTVRRDDLFSRDHQAIFDAMIRLSDADSPVDAVLLRAELSRTGELHDVGGTEYLGRILECVPSSAHVAHYAKVVAEKARLRRGIETANEVLRRSYDPDAAPVAIQQYMLERASGELATGQASDRIVTLEEVLHRVYDEASSGGMPLHPSGFRLLDDWLGGGFGEGEYVIVAGWPSHGKSALVKNIENTLCAAGLPGIHVTLEESASKIARNLLSAESGVPNKAIRSGKLTPDQFARMGEGLGRLVELPGVMRLSEGDATLPGVCNAISVAVARHGAKWAAIDHADLIDLGSVAGDGDTSKHDAISRTLARLRRRLNIVLFVVKQLSKPGAGVRRKPTPQDLRQSGAYHQDADVILLVDSDDVHNRENAGYTPTGVTTVSCSKAREGTGGTMLLDWDGRVQRFTEQKVRDPFD